MFRFHILAGLLVATFTASACLWNIDTTVFESMHIRDLDESLFGYFRRHSTAMYQWRVEDRETQLSKTPGDLDLIDDLAVSYEKIGQVRKAIELLEPVVEQHPQRYTSIANLGTMYIHAGELKRGAELIARAIEVNPNAHFGREATQLVLVRYLISRFGEGPISLPIGDESDNFAKFLFRHGYEVTPKDWESDEAFEAAYATMPEYEIGSGLSGISGMMRFGSHQSPVLYEALGDITAKQGKYMLAAIAYRRAADVTDGEISAKYHARSDANIARADEDSHDRFETDYRDHLRIAEDYFVELKSFEESAIAAYREDPSKNPSPDTAYFEKFDDDPEFDSGVRHVIQNPNPNISNGRPRMILRQVLIGISLAAIVLATVVITTRIVRGSSHLSSELKTPDRHPESQNVEA